MSLYLENAMLSKIKEIEKNHPIPFWVTCIIVFPLGILLFVCLLLERKSATDRNLLDSAARDQGQADVHEKIADTAAKEGRRLDGEIEVKRERVGDLVSRVKARAEKYKKKERQVREANSWDMLDKEAGVK